MKVTWRTVAAMLCYALGVLGWCYVGGWMTLTRPLKGLVLAHLAGELSVRKLIIAVVQGFIYLSMGGAVWCVGYMLSNYFRDKSKE